jgi:L,D-peptidoglycan transpeptidase YkuD (ErfK/YbiS/YcfS/YnhG family)
MNLNLGVVLVKRGSTKNKKEGDKKTPIGCFWN